jgi:pyruvate,water dikinase
VSDASTEERPLVVDLADAEATDPETTGGKAAALARAAFGGLATLPGLVLTTEFCKEIDGGASIESHPAVHEAFNRADGDKQPLVARSSSVVEDTVESSMAGQFESVIGIDGLEAFKVAVKEVLASRERAGAAEYPIAVLVQPLLEPRCGGVMFGVDPVSGRSDRRVISAVHGAPEQLVSGEARGSRFVTTPHGKVVDADTEDGPDLARTEVRRLIALGNAAARLFDGPQDVEWAIAHDGNLWLLQSRPVTTKVRGVPRGPVYGPGPIAETFPEPLTELEQDLWVPPLREAIHEAILLSGAATLSQLDASEIVVTVDGHVAIDLQLAGEVPQKHRVAHQFNPIVGARRMRGAWRVGRLRAALPRLAEHLLDRVDADLESVPALDDLTSRQLIALLHRSRAILRSLHAHEILMGMLTDTGRNRMTGASVALRVLVEARRDGLSDAEVLARSPVVLALTGPKVAPATQLPVDATAIHLGTDQDNMNDNGILREALRLRVRWVQELSGLAAWELGERLSAAGQLTEPELIRHMTLEHVEAVATKRAVVIPALVATHRHDFGSPLPSSFQLSDRGEVIRVRMANEVGGGTGAGGGVATGRVTYDTENPAPGTVLVTSTLSPGLAPLLPRLHGIVAETGSVLSHLAILAREARVATVVGYAGALEELPDGALVRVDGESGQVDVQEEESQ